MGGGIAEVAAFHGHEVLLRAREQSTADGTLAGIEKSLHKRVAKGSVTEEDAAATLDRITATSDLSLLSDCDLVIETIVEDLACKKRIFKDLDRFCGDATIIATNTSTLPVIEMAMETRRPDRVCGIHFFNPAHLMGVVEVVRPLTASDETIATARAFAQECGKTAIEVKDQAGFVVNALLFPYLNNAVRILEHGVAGRDDIDAAMRGACGFPMGPFQLLDLVGLDTSVAILDALYEEYRDPNYAAMPLLRRMVAAEQLGRKSGSGFYDYHGG